MQKKGVFKLLIGVVIIVLMVGYVVPAINASTSNAVMQFINENELDTGVLFYTESDEGLEAVRKLNK